MGTLRDRNVRRVALARFISRSGGLAAFFVGVWGKAAFEFDATAGQLALVFVALGVAGLVGSMIAGVLTDRFDPRIVLIWGEVLFMPATVAMILASNMAQLTLFAGFLGLANAPIFTASGAFAPYLTEDDDELQRINIVMETAGMASLIAGTAIGAAIVHFLDLDWVFVFDALTSVVAVLLVATVSVRRIDKPPRSVMRREAVEGFAHAYRSVPLRYFILLASAVWLVFGSFSALEPLFYRDVLGADSPEVIGWVNTVFGVGLVIGALALSRLPAGLVSARGLALITALNGLGGLLYIGTDRLWVVVIGALVWGSILGLLGPVVRTLVHRNSPPHMLGRISSVMEFQAQTAELLPLVVVAPLVAWLGVQGVLVGVLSALAVVSLLSMPRARFVDGLVVVVDEPPELAVEPMWPHL